MYVKFKITEQNKRLSCKEISFYFFIHENKSTHIKNLSIFTQTDVYTRHGNKE